MARESDTQYLLERLGSGLPRDRARVLQVLADHPVADHQILAACERLLQDRTMALLRLPFAFGEVRWNAADAAAAIRGVLGISDPVVIDDAFPPCSGTKVSEFSKAAGVKAAAGGTEGVVEALETLAAMGRLPRRRITRTPG